MILVHKPNAAPAKLAEGIAPNQVNCDLYDATPLEYDSGRLKFEISSTIYGHSQVKNVLRTAQHSKCCFCEGVFEAHAAADVEHFRPKKYSQQGRKGAVTYPGYYWLGYSWSNLYYCCQVCNRSHKKNYFPLRDPAQRARNHNGDVAEEAPLLLDPGGPGNPRDHIIFKDEVAVGLTDEGKATIDYVGLNRPPLIEARLERYQQIQTLRQLADLPEDHAEPALLPLIGQAKDLLAEAVLPTAKFSAMVSDYLAAAPGN